MLNRAVLVVRYTQAFIEWVNAVDPIPDNKIELSDANTDSTAYLIEVEDEREFEEWLKLNGDILFEEILNDWYTDTALWPADRSLALFKKWCTFELHTLVLDTSESPIIDDEKDDEFET